ncbi:MAG: lipoyl synthase [Actinobacteria bacterium]|nr:lipoyl synthase [Actinomycetota bacterium]
MSDAPARRRKPAWLKVKAPEPRRYRATGALLDELELHTVCREARCPNKSECYSSGTATFLILGNTCTRGCRFCSIAGAGPTPAVDADEPRRVAEAAGRLGLRHVVITSVTRDDLADSGASAFAAVVEAVRAELPAATVEVLIPDLGGDEAALAAVLAARPDVLNHNLETVPRLYAEVRPQADYERSLQLLRRAASWAHAATSAASEGVRGGAGAPAPGRAALARPLVKSGLMVGLGERTAEVEAVLGDCAAAGVDAVTIGQYLQPDADRLPVARYVAPQEFAAYEKRGAALGLQVAAAPFVRSSYRAGELLERPAGGRSCA